MSIPRELEALPAGTLVPVEWVRSLLVDTEEIPAVDESEEATLLMWAEIATENYTEATWGSGGTARGRKGSTA